MAEFLVRHDKVLIATAHLESDNNSQETRRQQCEYIFPLLKEATHSLWLGDFNICATSPENEHLAGYDFHDIWPMLKSEEESGWTKNTDVNLMAAATKKSHKARLDRVLMRSPSLGRDEGRERHHRHHRRSHHHDQKRQNDQGSEIIEADAPKVTSDDDKSDDDRRRKQSGPEDKEVRRNRFEDDPASSDDQQELVDLTNQMKLKNASSLSHVTLSSSAELPQDGYHPVLLQPSPSPSPAQSPVSQQSPPSPVGPSPLSSSSPAPAAGWYPDHIELLGTKPISEEQPHIYPSDHFGLLCVVTIK